MDIQLVIVIFCVVAALYYFVRRMYRSVKSGKCACCEDGASSKKGSCGCGCSQPRKAVITRFDEATHSMSAKDATVVEERTMSIEGMMCGNCEAHVKHALESLDGVISATASHKKGTATVCLSRKIPDETLGQAVTSAGYTFRGVVVI
ncbi:MAG: cation transporter [Desulfovibrio sp.]|nr:cation transporter [Desulfovibrio sp.]